MCFRKIFECIVINQNKASVQGNLFIHWSILFSLASLVLEGTLANCSLFNIPSIILRPNKYNSITLIKMHNEAMKHKRKCNGVNGKNTQQVLLDILQIIFKL